MSFQDVYLLIPSHSLEDFPQELPEQQAAGILNAFAVAWHPLLLAGSDRIPEWHRADEPPQQLDGRLIFVPECAEDWLPGGWIDHARADGATIVSGIHDRAEMLAAALAPLDDSRSIDPNLAADFHALGTCWLLLELLTRQMHHFTSLDEAYLHRESLAAAENAIAGDAEGCRSRLRTCFELLTEARERFYPVDCYLLDVCLLIPRLADEHFQTWLDARYPLSILAAPSDLEEIARDKPDVLRTLGELWNAGALDVCGGELTERPTPLMPLESVLWDFRRGHALYREMFGRTPTTWGRRRFGFTTLVPQILDRFGYDAALHVALDDGIYPDAEMSKIQWEGCDGTSVDAISRIPLPAEGAGAYLRLPVRMAESMQEDQTAAVAFARWPEVRDPWFHDLHRMQQYAPVLGRFVTLEEFFHNTEAPGRLSMYEAREYFAPFLIHSVARQEQCPIGRYMDHLARRQRFDAADWANAVAAALTGQSIEPLTVPDSRVRRTSTSVDAAEAAGDDRDDPDVSESSTDEDVGRTVEVETLVETAGVEGTAEEVAAAEAALDAVLPSHTEASDFSVRRTSTSVDAIEEQGSAEVAEPSTDEDVRRTVSAEVDCDAARRLADVIMHGSDAGAREPGVLLINTLAFDRRATVDLPMLETPPGIGKKHQPEAQARETPNQQTHQPDAQARTPTNESVKAVQFDDHRKSVTVQLPGSGFVWLPASSDPPAETGRKPPSTVEEGVLRNEFFEVHINEATGGIASIKGHGRSPNRISQQIAFRFPRERTVRTGEDDEGESTYYSAMRRVTTEITCDGPALAEAVTTGEIVDQKNGTVLAGYQQSVRVWRGRPVAEIDLELEVERMPEGDPWTNYYAARFAWNDETAALTRSVQQQAQGFSGERFDSPHYVEIASEEERTTILTMGLPFHRKTGRRMLDSLLIVEGETRRRFRFVIAVDVPWPMQAALDAMIPPLVVPTETGPPRSGTQGWFFHLSTKAVQIARVLPLVSAPVESTDEANRMSDEFTDDTFSPPAEPDEQASKSRDKLDAEKYSHQPDAQARAVSVQPQPSLARRASVSSRPPQGSQLQSAQASSEQNAGSEESPADAPPHSAERTGFGLRLVETEGRSRQAVLTCFRAPTAARTRDFTGRTRSECPIEDGKVLVSMAGYEIADVELYFD